MDVNMWPFKSPQYTHATWTLKHQRFHHEGLKHSHMGHINQLANKFPGLCPSVQIPKNLRINLTISSSVKTKLKFIRERTFSSPIAPFFRWLLSTLILWLVSLDTFSKPKTIFVCKSSFCIGHTSKLAAGFPMLTCNYSQYFIGIIWFWLTKLLCQIQLWVYLRERLEGKRDCYCF